MGRDLLQVIQVQPPFDGLVPGLVILVTVMWLTFIDPFLHSRHSAKHVLCFT